MNYVSIFLIYLTSDYAAALWAEACARKDPLRAAHWAFTYHALHGLGVLYVVADPWCIIPLALGGWIGTYFAILRRGWR